MREQRNASMHPDAGDNASLYPQKTPSSTRQYKPNARNALIPSGLHPGQVFQGADGVEYMVMPGSRPSSLPARTSRGQVNTDTAAIPLPRQRAKGNVTVTLLLGGALTLLGIWLAITIAAWWTGVQQDWTYTKDFRTSSVDQVVGHGGDSAAHPTHFIVQNDKGRILIIELAADDPKKAIVMLGPTFLGAEREPVTVTFQDTTGSGHLDLVLHCQGRPIVYRNTGSQFVSPSE